MSIGKDTPPPAPLVLTDMLAMHAWNPQLDDETRTLCGLAADTIRCVVRINAQLRHDKEALEADNAHLFMLHYGPQQGGAA